MNPSVAYIVEFGVWMTPALLLFCCLFARRYPGERVLTRLRRGRGPSRDRVANVALVSQSTPERVVSGGLLLAHRLAGRAPPLTV